MSVSLWAQREHCVFSKWVCLCEFPVQGPKCFSKKKKKEKTKEEKSRWLEGDNQTTVNCESRVFKKLLLEILSRNYIVSGNFCKI